MTALAAMTRAQKAAAILVAMGKPSASRLLKFFKQEELRALVEGARHLRTIPQADLEKIVAEFEAEFAEGVGLLDSADKMDLILNETLSPEEMSALMGTNEPAVPANAPPPVWPLVEKIDPARLGEFLAVEHPQTAAVVLSNLAPPAAAGVLMTLDKGFRSEIVKRMLSMSAVPPAATRMVENQLRSRVLVERATKDTSIGQNRVASLLNELDKGQLDEVMAELASAGAPDLEAIRSRLFSFEDIPLLSQKSRVALFDGLASDLVTMALRGAPAPLIEAVLSAIGARSRRMIESELGQETSASVSDVAKARKNIASTAIRLSREGSVELPAPDQAPAQDAA